MFFNHPLNCCYRQMRFLQGRLFRLQQILEWFHSPMKFAVHFQKFSVPILIISRWTECQVSTQDCFCCCRGRYRVYHTSLYSTPQFFVIHKDSLIWESQFGIGNLILGLTLANPINRGGFFQLKISLLLTLKLLTSNF